MIQQGGGGVQQQKRSCRREKPKMSFVFFVLFQNTFKIDVFVPNLVEDVSSKKNKKDYDFRIFDLLCSFLFFCCFCRIWLTKCPQTENKKDHAAEKIARCPLSFLLLDPPPPFNRDVHAKFVFLTAYIECSML